MLNRLVLRDESVAQWLNFSNPHSILVAHQASEVLAVLAEAERQVCEENRYAVGFVTFGAAPAFDPSFVTHTESTLPLVCFGVYSEPERLACLGSVAPEEKTSALWHFSETRDAYLQDLSAIKRQIELGNTYQVNYTVRQRLERCGNPWSLFLNIAADAPYAAYIECEDHAIVSASPELFFRLDGDDLVCKPMKGTAGRGMTQADDLVLRDELRRSIKNRAENVMITDMVRNDMGRIAIAGSVCVPALFDIEKYPTVWQLTSTVTAKTKVSVTDIFQALFPSASVTGAPKISSMEIIADLEKSPRSVYTGAIGFIGPDRQAQFNVAIRTVLINTKTQKAIYGVGGGIVWDSNPEDEYEECLTKARVLSSLASGRQFKLLETMLWTPEHGLFLGKEHLDRLCETAAYFDYECSRSKIGDAIEKVTQTLPQERHRIRLLLSREGRVHISHSIELPNIDSAPRSIGLAFEPIDTSNPFLYHKTTQREVYERALGMSNSDDVILWNTAGEITESCIANIAIKIDDDWWTPPVSSGLLAGTCRNWLLKKGEIKESRISLSRLKAGTEVMLMNSIRGKYFRIADQAFAQRK